MVAHRKDATAHAHPNDRKCGVADRHAHAGGADGGEADGAEATPGGGGQVPATGHRGRARAEEGVREGATRDEEDPGRVT